MGEQFTLDISKERSIIHPRKKIEKKQNTSQLLAFYIGSSGSIGFAIVIPLLLGIGIGVWLDTKYGTKPQFTLGGLVVGLVLSVANLIFTVKQILKKMPVP
jgi:ATP synthase protein I